MSDGVKTTPNNDEKNVNASPDVNIDIIRAVDAKSSQQLWDEIGFHKPLAGYWYKISFYLFSLIFGIALVSIWYRYFYPYPESMGYRSAATGIFSLFFSIMDLGTHRTMDRFIAESRIKNPQIMIHYIQYFIWYQMITGLFQTTAVSIYALYVVPRTELAYSVWIMLLHSVTQYPGFLGVFGGVLSSLQHFDKTEVLNFISGEVFQRITEIGFVLLGRYIGMQNPVIGEIMGIAFGACIGLYIDDFFATWLAAHYFSKVMKSQGITVRDCFRIGFDKQFVKETLTFGIKTGMPGIIGLSVDLVILWTWIHYVPQYTTFTSLSSMAGGISGLMGEAMGIRLSMLVSESYLNEKKKLTQYYISQTIRFAGQFQAFLIPILIIVTMALPYVYPVLGLNNYILAIPFIIPRLIRELQQPYTSLADEICLGTNHPTWLMFIRFVEELQKIFWMMLWIVWLRLPDKFGISAIIWIMPCGIYPAILFKTAASFIFIQKKVLKIKVAWWQSFIAPFLSGGVMFLIGLIGKVTVFDYFVQQNKVIEGALIEILIMFFALFFYFFLTVYLGGWDNDNLAMFKKAAKMSGPSRLFVVPLYKIVEFAAKHSKLHNKFRIPADEPEKEARELLVLKHSHDVKINKK